MSARRIITAILGAIAVGLAQGKIAPELANELCDPLGKLLRLTESAIKYKP